jgi:hypothetical protein
MREDEYCHNCLCWKPIKENDRKGQGECHYYPPKEAGMLGTWPMTSSTDWCCVGWTSEDEEEPVLVPEPPSTEEEHVRAS